MHVRLSRLAAALIACSTPAWAATSNVDVYGQLDVSVDTISLPTHETYSAAADIFFDPTYTPLIDATTSAGLTAQISGTTYSASASTTQGSNHAYVQASSFPTGAFGATSFSGWYDQVTITGGTGAGTAQFSVQLSGTVDVGAIAGGIGYGLSASSVHPTQLTSDVIVDVVSTPTNPWFLDSNQVTPITTYMIGASPYNDTAILFPSEPPTLPGIPAVEDPSNLLGGEPIDPVVPDLVLTPGAAQSVNVTLHGTLNFTYGEGFYLIGGLNATLLDTSPFLAFCISECPPPPAIDGTGATTLDFSNSANLVNIVLPEGATASFASGNAYNVTSVPEPGEWLMLLAGLGLVGWRTRRKAAKVLSDPTMPPQDAGHFVLGELQ